MDFGKWDVKISFDAMPQPVATAMEGLGDEVLGAKYEMIAYLGSQVVNGTNYAVLAKQILATGQDNQNVVVLKFNQKTKDIVPALIGVEHILDEGAPMGGVTVDIQTEISKENQKIWYDGIEGYVGFSMQPIAYLGSQVVDGVNHFFAVEGTSVSLTPETYVFLAVINQQNKEFKLIDMLEDRASNALGYSFTWLTNSNRKVKLSAPWVTYAREINEMFGRDPQIKVEYDEDNVEVKLYVENPDKAEAITQLLPVEKFFGGVSLKITVIPANNFNSAAKSLFDRAFDGNPVFAHTSEFQGLYNQPVTYVVFKKAVVQYFSDNLGDEHGLTSTLYQDIAKDLFEVNGVCYCTDIEDIVYNDGKNLGAPLGEWP